ncbi:hypothetical protein [Streptomyces sp. STCH 565 A]|uniref:hypothetical protein n=1 Tax=Streptomyces sp. STCH 565 A TaxID=2950532 RepID=UPI002075EAD1|nr:hypothetical protein [Streptomyces sp. STCH 565 A]MCM8552265.1 hypothetical protein [Streptomyces sp. STCH 565 A]
MTSPLCGAPHHDHPDTLCTQPADHYRRDRDPHGGPLIIDGRECGGAAWDEPQETPMTEETGPEQCPPGVHSIFDPCPGDCGKPVDDEPATDGYCPACGRGDCAPTPDEYEQQRQRAARAEAALVRVHHLAAAIHAGAPWTANHTETATRIRNAITGPTTTED